MAKQPATNQDEEQPEEATSAVPESHADGIIDAIEKNRILVLGGFAAFVVVLLLILAFRQMGKQKHLEAGRAFTSAATARDVAALDRVVEKFAGSVPAGNALLTKADVQIDQGKVQDAIATLTEFARTYPEHPRFAQAYFMLGNIYHQSEDYARARENYEKVLQFQMDGELSPITRIRLGDLALAEGDEEKARQNYEESFTIHPGNPFVPTAERRLELLKVGTPPVVDPPEPEPEEESTPAHSIELKKDDEAPETEAQPVKESPGESAGEKETPKGGGNEAGKAEKGKAAEKGEKAKGEKAGSPEVPEPDPAEPTERGE